ncbi:MAG: phosphoribosylanthranilate isomerase [Gemmatimonadota bacterium]
MRSVREAWLAVEHGADAIGLVSAMPSGPGPIPDDRIAAIARAVPPGVATFLLTCRTDPGDLVEQVRTAGVDTVQLVDRVPRLAYVLLASLLPAVRRVQVVHVNGEEAVADAVVAAAAGVHAVLLDSGDPTLPVKRLGGTGRTHDWDLSRRIREEIPVPLWLAGGLHAGNVGDAIARVRPFGVDVCTGVRTRGRLDREKLARFVAGVRAASS